MMCMLMCICLYAVMCGWVSVSVLCKHLYVHDFDYKNINVIYLIVLGSWMLPDVVQCG